MALTHWIALSVSLEKLAGRAALTSVFSDASGGGHGVRQLLVQLKTLWLLRG